MKRRLLLICIAILLLAGVTPFAGSFADGDHPIVLLIQCETDPELETDGVIPDLLFTIRNTGTEDYTLEHAELSGGFEDKTLILDEQITVLAGATKEFHLTDVFVSDAQLDQDVTYRLSWEETEWVADEENETMTAIAHKRETEAQIVIARFIPPELTVTAKASAERVRAGETFTVAYTILNDTKFDMSGLRLYDPEQSMQSIGLPSSDLFAGESRSVEVTYTMGKEDMQFSPVIEYTVRNSEQRTRIETPLTVESVVVELLIEVEQYPTTNEGSPFAITVRNAGNRTVTGIQLYDEINTPIESPFDLAPEQSKVLSYTVPSAISAGTIRKIRFHLTAVDAFENTFVVTDPNAYDAVPYVDSDSVRLSLYVTMQRAYYDENGKLCGSIQFEIRNYSSVALHSATLTELRLFGELQSYSDLQNGVTYYVTSLQLDGVPELSFRVDALDPAGQRCSSETILLDLARLKELADQTDDPVYVYPNNPYFKDLDVKYRGILRIAAIIVLGVAAVCAIVCIVLYAIERKLKAKLPAEFEENMESTLQKTKRRVDTPMFGDVPTEQFGYTVPIKLRNYGELTEEEAAARKQAYQAKLDENLREYGASPAAISKRRAPEQPRQNGGESLGGTRIMPVARPKATPPVRDDITLISVNPAAPEKPAEEPKKQVKPTAPQRKQPEAKKPPEGKKTREKGKPAEPKKTVEPKQPTQAKPQTAQKAESVRPQPTVEKPKAEPVRPQPTVEKPKAESVRPQPTVEQPKAEPARTETAAFERPKPVRPVAAPQPEPQPVKFEPQIEPTPEPQPKPAALQPEPQPEPAALQPEPQSIIPEPTPIESEVVIPTPIEPQPELTPIEQETVLPTPIEPQPEPQPVETEETIAPRTLFDAHRPARRPVSEQRIIRMNG